MEIFKSILMPATVDANKIQLIPDDEFLTWDGIVIPLYVELAEQHPINTIESRFDSVEQRAAFGEGNCVSGPTQV